MGYTHYWYRPKELDAEKFMAYAADCKKIYDDGVLNVGLDGDIEGPPIFDEKMIFFNGEHGESCESFYMPREIFYAPRESEGNDKLYFQFCKTRRHPYDTMVQMCLIALKHHFVAVVIKSDGDNDEWQAARELCQKHLGYGADFVLE